MFSSRSRPNIAFVKRNAWRVTSLRTSVWEDNLWRASFIMSCKHWKVCPNFVNLAQIIVYMIMWKFCRCYLLCGRPHSLDARRTYCDKTKSRAEEKWPRTLVQSTETSTSSPNLARSAYNACTPPKSVQVWWKSGGTRTTGILAKCCTSWMES